MCNSVVTRQMGDCINKISLYSLLRHVQGRPSFSTVVELFVISYRMLATLLDATQHLSLWYI